MTKGTTLYDLKDPSIKLKLSVNTLREGVYNGYEKAIIQTSIFWGLLESCLKFPAELHYCQEWQVL